MRAMSLFHPHVHIPPACMRVDMRVDMRVELFFFHAGGIIFFFMRVELFFFSCGWNYFFFHAGGIIFFLRTLGTALTRGPA
jgi:hypothetical protein